MSEMVFNSDKQYCCGQMQWAIDERETGLIYVPKFDEYGIKVMDGGSSFIELSFCPWCGNKLPDSRRSEWFTRLEAAGIDPYGEGIPIEFQNAAWYAVSSSVEGI